MEWRRIPGYTLYMISDEGQIKTFNWKNKGTEAIMKPALDPNGYWRTMLKRDIDGKIHTIKVHRLVALTFLGEPVPGFDHVNHINSIRSDSRVENLEWVSRSQNVLHSFRQGMSSNKGTLNPACKLTEDQVREIRSNYVYGRKNKVKGALTKLDFALKYNCSTGTIRDIISKKTWPHLI